MAKPLKRFRFILQQLLQEHGITVRESRGRFSYLTAGRTKPISSRKLGDDFSKEKVLAVLAENVERKKTAKLYSSDPHPDRISRLIDIQDKLAAGKGAGYEHWTKIFNLKQLAKSMALFIRYNLNSEEELDARVKELAEMPTLLTNSEQRKAVQVILENHLVYLAALGFDLSSMTESKGEQSA